MSLGRHHRFTDDVGQVGPDGEIPVKSHRAQGRAGDKAAAYSEESAENADEKPDDRQIDRADVRAGDGKKHGLFRAPAEKTQQKGRQGFEHDGLADDEENGHASISVSMAHFQLMQRFTEEMEDEKEVADDEKGIDDELDEKGSQSLG